MRDEIKLIARDLCLAIHNEKGQMIYGPACTCERVEQAILSQVKKARADALEEAAKIAEDNCEHVTRKCLPEYEEICNACQIASAIRNKLDRAEK